MDDYESDLADAKTEAYQSRKYQQALNRAPNCSDPSHPGCEDCDTSFMDQED